MKDNISRIWIQCHSCSEMAHTLTVDAEYLKGGKMCLGIF